MVEQRDFQTDHARVGYVLAMNWCLPEKIVWALEIITSCMANATVMVLRRKLLLGVTK